MRYAQGSKVRGRAERYVLRGTAVSFFPVTLIWTMSEGEDVPMGL